MGSEGRVGIININEFSAKPVRTLRTQYAVSRKALGHRPTGYILDLRSNPGGILGEAVGVSGVFLDGGEVALDRGRQRTTSTVIMPTETTTPAARRLSC